MKKRVYVETTVVSYFTAKPSRDLMIAGHQEATRELWPQIASQYEAYVSALVYEEAGKGDPEQARTRLAAMKPFRMLDIDDDARALAEKILTGKGVPQEYPEDALHIALKSARLKSYWRLTNERPDCRRSAEVADGAYTEVPGRPFGHLRRPTCHPRSIGT
jgi:hypothetical protein